MAMTMTAKIDQAWTYDEIYHANTAASYPLMTDVEKEVVLYYNLARLYPQKFAQVELSKEKKTPPRIGWPMEDIDVLGKAKYLAETMDSVSAGVSNEEKEKIRNYSLTLSAIPATEPLNEEARRRHFDNLIAALDGFSMEERRRYPYFEDLMSLVKKAREYQPSDVEKQLMADPGELKLLADDNPLREYKSADQYNDLQLLAQEQQKAQ